MTINPSYEEMERRVQELEKENRLLEMILDSIPDIIGIQNPDHTIVRYNKAGYEVLGMNHDQVVGKPCFSLLGKTEICENCATARALKSKQLETAELFIPELDRHLLCKSNPILDKTGEVRLIVEQLQDITAFKQAVEALHENKILFKKLSPHVPGMVFQFMRRADGTYCMPFSSDHIRDIFGCSSQDVAKDFSPIARVILPEDLSKLIDSIESSAKDMTVWHCEYRVQIPGKPVRWMSGWSTPDKLADGSIIWHGFNTDITERKQAEEALRRSEEKYRDLVSALPQAVFESDRNGILRYVNDITFEMFGYDCADFSPGKYNVLEMIAQEERERAQTDINNLLSTGKSVSPEYLALKKDGSKFPVQIYSTRTMHGGNPTGMIGIILDITDRKHAEQERKKLESQLVQAQKMESVGRLAGGVAHDFNNMLGIILGHTEMGLDTMHPSQPLYSSLREIQQAAKRSAELTKGLLAFARKQTIAPKVLDLNETVESMLKMLRRLIGEDIDLLWRPGQNLWPVKMDSIQIDQILANLCSNSRDAIINVGRITIETGNVVLREDDCVEPSPWLVPGEYVLLTVSDDGIGINKKDLQNIFEPFFTTKEVGKGTGLGLPIVYGIVKQNRGFINAYSEIGQGTTFRIYLPRHLEEPEAETDQVKADTITGGNETVLLVEDEPLLLKMCKMMLEKLGYRVLPAVLPSEATRLAEKHSNEIDLLITDIVMPEMNGGDLAAQIKDLHPQLKCLFISGYTANVIAHHGILKKGLHFLQKPFSLEVLAEKVREVLDDRR
jgi:two-component system, cell cycle sensor histidine kinase and response regulator CckA